MSLILILLASIHAFQRMATELEIRSAELINTSGRQRMLSQRILHLAERHHRTEDAAAGALLSTALREFATAHEAIAEDAQRIPAARAHYFDPDGPQLDARSRRFVELATVVYSSSLGHPDRTAAIRELRPMAMSSLLESLNRATKIFEEDVKARSEQARTAQDAALAAAIIVLIVEALLIFMPAHRTVIRTLNGLEASNRAIRQKSLQLEEYAERLAFAAFNDPLTGLTNRKKLHDDLDRMLSGGDLDHRRVCVIHADLDRFKEINDTMGHAVGDAVLKRVAEIMVSRLRPEDIVARVGGDEFVIVVELEPGEGAGRIQEICDGLIARITQPMAVCGMEARVGASIGYTFASPEVREADVLISNADIALYEAKRAGRGNARPFTATMRAGIERRRALVREIELALDRGEFIPYMQPQVAMETGEIVGLEILARWHHPERGCLKPGEFLEVAEEIGMVDAIDARVTLDGLNALAALRQEGWNSPRISLNASTRTMRYADYADRLEEAVRARGLAPADVVVEVLETTLIEDADDQAARSIAALNEAGFAVHVDDFGTGYASLASLSKLEISGLKIDRSLISDIAAERTAQVVSAVVGLAGALNLTVVAEGVETPRQFTELRRLGVASAQGFGIAIPMPIAELRSWYATYGKVGRLPG